MNDAADGSSVDRPLPRSLLVARDYFPPHVGGISTMMARVMTEVAPRDVCCLAGCGGAEYIATSEGRARVYRATLPFRLPTPFDTVALAATLSAITLSRRIRALMLATIDEGYVGLLAQWLFRVPFVVFAHGNEVLSLRDSKWPRAMQALRAASAVMANSHYTAGLLCDLGITPERIRVVHPGCDPLEFRPVDVDAPTRDRLLEGRRADFVLLTVGNVVERKGHDVVLRAMVKLRKAIPNLLYVIAGCGPYEGELRRLASELSVADRVLFKGYVPDGDLCSLYASSDLFLMPSRFLAADHDVEGFGIVYLEASACGRAVIGGHSGGVEDAIVNGKTGLLVSPSDVDDLERAVLRLWRDHELRATLGAAGRRRIVSELTWSHFGAKVRAVVRQCVHAAPSAAVRNQTISAPRPPS